MKLRRASALLLVIAISACDRLEVDPGHGFGVRVLTPSPVAGVGKITVPLRFAITGCDLFDAEIRGGAGAGHAVELLNEPGGTFLAEVPVDWLRGVDGTCLHDARTPLVSAAQVLVTCRDAGRIATADLAVSYGTATRADLVQSSLTQATTQFLFPSADPLVPHAVASWFSTAYVYPQGFSFPLSIEASLSSVEPLVRPRLAANDSALFLSSGCPIEIACPDLQVSPDATVPSEEIWGRTLLPLPCPSTGCDAFHVAVPSHVIDMAIGTDGALVVLSQLYDERSLPPWPTAIVVTRISPAGESFIGYFPGESAETRFSTTADGRLAFVSFVIPSSGPIHSVLHQTDGTSVSSSPNPTGALDLGEVVAGSDGPMLTNVGSAQLSPDASSLVVNGSHLGSPGSLLAALPAAGAYAGDGEAGGAAWLTGAVGLWRGASLMWGAPASADLGGVEVFGAAPPHDRVYAYDVHALPGSNGPAVLHGAVAVGDKLVLTTSTGVRVLGPDGTVVGGSDPLPCGLTPTAVAVRTGPRTAAVAAGRYLYVFDLAE